MSSWRDLVDHDGVVLIQLSLFDTKSGGPKREISSGYKADWIWGPDPSGLAPSPPMLPVRAPLDMDDDGLGCIRPGETAVVRAHPFQPEAWAALPLRTTVQLCRLTRSAAPGFTVIGEGTILATVDLPDQPVPLGVDHRPLRPGHARLRRVGP
jgi:hypothetical protein